MALPRNILDEVTYFNVQKIYFKEINLLSPSQIFLFEVSLKRLKPNRLVNVLKWFSLENYFKSVSTFFLFSNKHKNNVKHLFVNDIFNQSMVMNMRILQKEFSDPFIEVITDTRLKGSTGVFLYRYFKPGKFIRQWLELRRGKSGYHSILKELSVRFGVKTYLLRLNLLDSLFIYNCVEGFLDTHGSIRHIILNTDVHKISRIFTLIAQQRAIKTYVLQHGSTVLEYGYLPVESDYLFSWGPLSSQWFVDRGTGKSKLVELGTPKMDGIVNFIIESSHLTSVENILLILNPIGDNEVDNYLNLAFKANLHADYNLSIKLHPGSLDNRDLVTARYSEDEVKIFKQENIHELIYKNDVVITTSSTVGNEAIALNKPLIQVKIPGNGTTMDYEKYDCSHIVNNEDELKWLLGNIDKLESKKVNYQKFISKYFYKLDGNSAKRIRNFIIKSN